MKAVGARLPRYDGIAPRHRPHRLRRRRPRSPASLWVKALRSPLAPRGDHEARHGAGRGDEGRPRGRHPRGRAAERLRAPLGARHPGRRAAARRGRGPLQGPADRRRRGRGRGARRRPPSRRSSSSSRSSPALFDIRKAFDPDAPQIHQWGNWYPHFEAEMDRRQIRKGDIDARVRPGRHDRPGRLPAGRDRARPARDAGLPGRARAERPPDDLLVHAGALLLDGRRRRAPAAAAEQAQVRRRHRRRRLRRQGRHGHRDDVLRCSRSSPASRCSGAGRARRSSSARRRGRRGTWRSRTRSRRTAGSSAARC